MDRIITVAFSPHRVETLPLAYEIMKDHDLIVLEEPYNKKFYQLLEDEVSSEEYITLGAYGFPVFEKNFIKILKELYKKGKKILQIEPYLEKVAYIQEKIANSTNIEDIINTPELKKIFDIENEATGKLLNYYKASVGTDFKKIINAVKEFAKVDAKRFRIRDFLRAKAILSILPEKGKIYIEAGVIHLYFKKLLHLFLKNSKWKVRHKFLLREEIKKRTKKIRLFHPGEILTLRYIFKLKEKPELEDLLSARSLIYIKIVPKKELLPTEEEPFPHLAKEIKVIQMVNKLSFEDCETLYKKLFPIRDYEEAFKVVEKFLNKKY